MRNKKNMKSLLAAAALVFAAGSTARAADPPQAAIARSIEALGGTVVRGPDGNIVEVSLARTGASDNDIERVVQIKGLKRLNLSFTYVTDVGIERLREVPQLEELIAKAPPSLRIRSCMPRNPTPPPEAERDRLFSREMPFPESLISTLRSFPRCASVTEQVALPECRWTLVRLS